MLNLPMELPFLKKPERPQLERQYLFAIEISPEVIKSAVWSIINGKTQVLAVAHAVNWDNKSAESLNTAVDQALADAVNHLDPSGKIAPDQVILGLPPTWIHEDKIVPDRLKLLKEMSSQLELKLVGFVVTPEAVVKYLQHTENMPPTAIFLGFWPHHLELTLVKLGKIIGIQLVNRSADVADDVVEGLSRFANIDMLPSRMLLYDSGLDLEEIRQVLLAHPWQSPNKKLPFLHFPKIEILPPDFTVKAIALSGGTEVAKAIGLLPTVDPTPVAAEPEADSTHTRIEDLGFVTDSPTAVTETQVMMQPHPQPQPEYLPDMQTRGHAQVQLDNRKKGFQMPQLRFRLPGGPIVIGLVALFFLLVILGGLYWYLPRATVVLRVTPQEINKNFTLLASTGGSATDSATLEIGASELQADVSDSSSTPTTGSKLVGDKATGEVQILNTTDTPRKLTAGTILNSPSGLKFVTDAEVTVASGSGSVFNPQPGKATVKITASQIGGDYNLSAGTEFRVASFATTQIAAKNDAAISGGSSRQVKAVTKDDMAKLRTGLVTALKDRAKEELNKKSDDQQTLIQESVTVETISENFNHKLDEVADDLTLELKVRAKGLSVDKEELDRLIGEQIKPQIPAGYTSIASQEQTMAVKKADKNSVLFDVSITARVLPEYNIGEIVDYIKGKYPVKAQDYLKGLPAVSEIEVAIRPKLPEFIATFPRIDNHIEVSVQDAE
jgi:hypothetical protein